MDPSVLANPTQWPNPLLGMNLTHVKAASLKVGDVIVSNQWSTGYVILQRVHSILTIPVTEERAGHLEIIFGKPLADPNRFPPEYEFMILDRCRYTPEQVAKAEEWLAERGTT